MAKNRSPSGLKQRVDTSALLLLDFMEKQRGGGFFKYPFSYSFPRNCCESVLLILTYLLEEKYGLDNVRIIKGTKSGINEHHFWVMVNDWNYDLTAHQFPRRKPIIGKFADELFLSVFKNWEIEQARDFVERDTVVALHRAGIIPF